MRSHPFFKRRQEKNRPLLTLSINSFDPAFVEIIAQFGIDVVWIEMEHASVTMREAENLCRIIQGTGMLSLIRLPNCQRENVLKAAETGADMLMAPMINDRTDLQNFINYARYSPEGERGFFSSSRGLNYSLGGTSAELRQRANDHLLLWAQIETLPALECMEEFCQASGVDGLFMGPGDLSVAYDVPGQASDPRVAAAIALGAKTTRQHQKLCGTVLPPTDVSKWKEHSLDMVSVGGNIGLYVNATKMLHEQLEKQGIALPLSMNR